MLSTLKERIEKHQWKRKGNACWPWLGYIDTDGHGRIWLDHKEGSILIPHAVWKAEGREILPGQKVLACPILKDCSNPNHISVGDSADIGDRILWKKNLKRRLPKEKIPIERKVSDEQVRQIFLSDKRTSELAEQYGISSALVTNIRARRKYQRVTDSLIQGD